MARDDYRKHRKDACEGCGLQPDYTLHVHHIDCSPKNNDADNLVTLCRKCHSQTHVEIRALLKASNVPQICGHKAVKLSDETYEIVRKVAFDQRMTQMDFVAQAVLFFKEHLEHSKAHHGLTGE